MPKNKGRHPADGNSNVNRPFKTFGKTGRTPEGTKPGKSKGRGFDSNTNEEEQDTVVDTSDSSSENTEVVEENSASEDEATFQAELDAGIY
ncbi:MAG: hypothetical protein AAGF07_01080 [Patescibacteria group bacterium]